jgi:hypothetical protein
MNDKEFLLELAKFFKEAKRIQHDNSGLEGGFVIFFSNELANILSDRLIVVAEKLNRDNTFPGKQPLGISLKKNIENMLRNISKATGVSVKYLQKEIK